MSLRPGRWLLVMALLAAAIGAAMALGLAVGPLLVGWLNDQGSIRYGDEAIRYSIAIMLCAHWWAALHLMAAVRRYRTDLPGGQWAG